MAAHTEVNYLVYLLVILFGIGSWITVNGLWVELPLLVPELPEGWNLPSYLVIIIQIANIGPLTYSLATKFCPGYVNENAVVYVIVAVGALASLLAAFLWKETLPIGGNMYSVALLTLAFFLSTVDCTSSVVFLPFMSRLKSQYMTAMFVGEGLSGLIPSLVALLQGASAGKKCVRTTTKNATGHSVSIVKAVSIPPLFSVDVFFVFLFFMMIVCGVAFFLLNYLSVSKREHVDPAHIIRFEGKIDGAKARSGQDQGSDSRPQDQDGYERLDDRRTNEGQDRPDSQNQDRRLAHSSKTGQDPPTNGSPTSGDPLLPGQGPSNRMYLYLLAMNAWMSAMSYGLLPSVQSYSALPYGHTSFLLSVTLSKIANPLTCFVLFFFPIKSTQAVSYLTLMATMLMVYIFFMAGESPTPPLVDEAMGGVVIVVIWIVYTVMQATVKCTVAAMLREIGWSALFWYGATEQSGSLLGAIVSFVMVSVLKMFTSKRVCA